MQEKAAAKLVVLVGGAVLALAAIISATDVRPYNERAILAQIDDSNSLLCGKFGVAAATPKFAECMRDLSELQQQYVELLRANSWL